MKKFFIVPALLIFFLGGCTLFSGDQAPKNPDPNHTHADFAVWINGEKLDFSAEKYMPSEPAEPEETSSQFFPRAAAHSGVIHETSEEAADHDNLQQYLHLHDGNGHIIHRHKPGLSIGDFFTSIGFTMTAECLTLDTGEEYCNNGKNHWKMFINEAEVAMNPSYVFADLDRILLTYSASDTAYIDQLKDLTNDACLYSQNLPRTRHSSRGKLHLLIRPFRVL